MKLKDCPFCGSKNIITGWRQMIGYKAKHHCGCGDCLMFVKRFTKEEAIKAWNKRAIKDVVKQVELDKKEILKILDNAIQPRLEEYKNSGKFIYPTHSFKMFVAQAIVKAFKAGGLNK